MLESVVKCGNILREAVGHLGRNSRYRLGAGFLVLTVALATTCMFPEAARKVETVTRAAAPPVPRPSAAQLAKLVADLGADDFPTREAVERALEGVGAEAVPALVEGMKSADPEVRSRSLALALKAEKRAAAHFEALGADVQRDNTTGRVKIISYTYRDASKLRDEHLRELVGLPWLNRVWLNNAEVGDAGMVHVGRLTNLDILDLEGTRVTDAGLAHLAGLTNLETLCLRSTAVTGRGLVHVKGMKKLWTLSLYKAKVTDAGLAAGVGGINRSGCRSLNLSGTQVSDDGLACLKEVKHRFGLGLMDTRITACGLARLQAVPNLVALALSGTAVTDEACAQLAKIKTLEGVSLDETRVTVAGLRKLKVLPKLRSLDFRCVELSDKEKEELLDDMPSRVRIFGQNLVGRGRAAEKP